MSRCDRSETRPLDVSSELTRAVGKGGCQKRGLLEKRTPEPNMALIPCEEKNNSLIFIDSQSGGTYIFLLLVLEQIKEIKLEFN